MRPIDCLAIAILSAIVCIASSWIVLKAWRQSAGKQMQQGRQERPQSRQERGLRNRPGIKGKSDTNESCGSSQETHPKKEVEKCHVTQQQQNQKVSIQHPGSQRGNTQHLKRSANTSKTTKEPDQP